MASSSKTKETAQPGVAGIKHIVAIASGKGGVGKSTVSTNLAVAVSETGAKVGLMDADIYGPSQVGMLGSKDDQPQIGDNYFCPVTRHGVDFVSMGLLLGEDAPVIWRAPMATKMIQQFIGSVLWGELEYLFIDLPPGTGDVQITLAQQASLTGAVIVTTPQEVALGVTRKGLKMFQQVNVPIAGIIENMSGFICSHCGKETAIFKEGGGHRMAEEFGVPYLGALPLDPEIMKSGDEGVPVLRQSTDSPAAKAILDVAGELRKSLEKIKNQINAVEPKRIELKDDSQLIIQWPDGHVGEYSAYHLRTHCNCAACVDENTGRKILDPKRVPLDVKITGYNPVGRYGLAIAFSDGHNTGIYTYERLRKLCECAECKTKSGSKTESFDV